MSYNSRSSMEHDRSEELLQTQEHIKTHAIIWKRSMLNLATYIQYVLSKWYGQTQRLNSKCGAQRLNSSLGTLRATALWETSTNARAHTCTNARDQMEATHVEFEEDMRVEQMIRAIIIDMPVPCSTSKQLPWEKLRAIELLNSLCK